MQRLRRTLLTWLGVAGLVSAIWLPAPAAFADASSTWTGGPGAILDNTYDGFIDAPTSGATVPTGSFLFSGWFVDKTAQGWAGADDVQIFQGTMDGGGKMLTKANVAQGRPDVAAALGNPYWAASGFNAIIPAGALSAGPQTLSVYVHTGGKGWWFKQVNVNVSASAPTAPAPVAGAPAPSGSSLPIVAVEKPANGEQVSTHGDYEIIGYALDKSAGPNQGVAGSGVDRVEVYMDKERDDGGTFIGDADLGFSDSVPAQLYGPQFQSAGWRLTFKPTQFHVNTHNMFVYARSAVSGKEDLAVRYFAIHD